MDYDMMPWFLSLRKQSVIKYRNKRKYAKTTKY